jgi:hypothetical protein
LPLQHDASGKFSLATPNRGEESKVMQNNHESELLVTTDWLSAHLDDPEMRRRSQILVELVTESPISKQT